MPRFFQRGDGEQGQSDALPTEEAGGTRLDVPDPPDELPYAEYEDYLNREILRANGVGLSEAELVRVLAAQDNVLRAAAAHTLGAIGTRSRDALERVLDDSDDLVRVEGAYALARLGDPRGNEALAQELSRSIDAYISPPIAAGYLAQLGDPQGYQVVAQALDSSIVAIRVIASKQVSFFLPFEADRGGGAGDAWHLFERALSDTDGQVQWQALVQLKDVTSPRARTVLEQYVQRADDPQLKEYAERLLQGFSGTAR